MGEIEWFYQVRGEKRGPLSASKVLQLYQVGILKSDSPVWRRGMTDWMPLSASELLVPIAVRASGTSNARPKHKTWIPVTAVLVAVIVGGIFVYWRFFDISPIEGAWEHKNLFGAVNDMIVIDQGTIWVVDNQGQTQHGSFTAKVGGNGNYTLTLINKDGQTTDMYLYLRDSNSLDVGFSSQDNTETLTRMDETKAKNIMGIHS
ncbi:MAG: DUF4339 domain-containing protein [Ethanoligenens sp.]